MTAGHLTAGHLWHLGALHPAEQALTLLVAFGPFVVLAVVGLVRRRREAAGSGGEAGSGGAAGVRRR